MERVVDIAAILADPVQRARLLEAASAYIRSMAPSDRVFPMPPCDCGRNEWTWDQSWRLWRCACGRTR